MNSNNNRSQHRGLLKRELEGVARTLGDDRIKVSYGDEQYVATYDIDTNAIVVPSPKSDDRGYVGDNPDASITRGLMHHELAHHNYTDMGKEYDAFIASTKWKGQMHPIVNAFEDSSIERKAVREYPGVYKHMEKANEFCMEKVANDILGNPDKATEWATKDPASATLMGAMVRDITDTYGLDKDRAQKVIDLLAQGGPGFTEGVEFVAEQMQKVDSTMDAAKAAKAFLEKFNVPVDPEQQERPKPYGGKGEGGGDKQGRGQGESGQGQGEGGGDQQGEGQSQPQPDGPSYDPADEGQFPGGWGPTLGSTQQGPMDLDKIDRALQMAKVTNGNSASRHHEDYVRSKGPHIGDQNEIVHAYGDLRKGYDAVVVREHQNGVEKYMQHKQGMARTTAVVAGKLRRALLATRDRRFRSEANHGRLNPRKLLQAQRMDPNVFNKRSPSEDVNTSVCLLVDCSGSMAGAKFEAARAAVVALSEALKGIHGVEFGVFGFTDTIKSVNYVFKDYNESLNPTVMRRIMSTDIRMSSNADAIHVKQHALRLSERPNPRKVMIVLSDGQPCGLGWDRNYFHSYPKYGTWGDPIGSLRNAVSEASAMGIGMFGIGIMSTAVAEYYPDYAVINNVSDLSGTVIDAMVQKLGLNLNHKATA